MELSKIKNYVIIAIGASIGLSYQLHAGTYTLKVSNNTNMHADVTLHFDPHGCEVDLTQKISLAPGSTQSDIGYSCEIAGVSVKGTSPVQIATLHVPPLCGKIDFSHNQHGHLKFSLMYIAGQWRLSLDGGYHYLPMDVVAC